MAECLKDDSGEWMRRVRLLCERDLVFLLSEVLSTRNWWHPDYPKGHLKLFQHDWVIGFTRHMDCAESDELTIVSRGHCKSTVLTFGKIVKVLINNANATCGIFSITKDVAQKFAKMLMDELESNVLLRQLFPDRFFWNPSKESPSWSKTLGFTIRRPLIFKDPSVMPYGLVDSSFTGSRLTDSFYDDVVNEKVITSPEMIEKVNDRWELSLALGLPGCRRWYVGTFYAGGDSYHHLIERGVRLNLHSCYAINREESTFQDNGIPSRLVVDRSRPVLFSKDFLDKQEARMGPRTFAIQMLCTPTSEEVTEFRLEWFKRYRLRPERVRDGMNVVIIVDPASKKGSAKHSRTAMGVLGLGHNQNIFLLDGILDRLNLSERTEALFDLHRKWLPYEVRYEELGMHSDIEHIEYVQEQTNYRFNILPVKGNVEKEKRVEWLIPIAKAGRLWLPEKGIPYVMRDGNQLIDLVQWWLEKEILPFPNVMHLDFSDMMARVVDPECFNNWPIGNPDEYTDPWRRELYRDDEKPALSWMAN